MRRKILAIFGLLLLTLGFLGPLTFADDFRHLGEIAVVIGLILSGLSLLAPVLPLHWRCSTSFPVASPFVLLGLAVGTYLDKTMIGLLLGACLGSVAIWLHCSKRGPVAA
jgi:hypothetical protein